MARLRFPPCCTLQCSTTTPLTATFPTNGLRTNQIGTAVCVKRWREPHLGAVNPSPRGQSTASSTGLTASIPSNRSFTPSLLLEMPFLPTAAQQLPPVTNLSSFLTHLFPGSTAEELNASFHPCAQVKTPTAAFPMIVSHYLSRLK